ncbi:hypothetical protein IFR05_013526 [Cadophora sp. M221]|nr:hypothetical protein IFR05_013526 [Cadophora sp. M221]
MDERLSPLSQAVLSGETAKVVELLQAGVNPTLNDPDGVSPISRAISNGEQRYFALMLSRCPNLSFYPEYSAEQLEQMAREDRHPSFSWAYAGFAVKQSLKQFVSLILTFITTWNFYQFSLSYQGPLSALVRLFAWPSLLASAAHGSFFEMYVRAYPKVNHRNLFLDFFLADLVWVALRCGFYQMPRFGPFVETAWNRPLAKRSYALSAVVYFACRFLRAALYSKFTGCDAQKSSQQLRMIGAEIHRDLQDYGGDGEEMMLAFVKAAVNVQVASSHPKKCHSLMVQASSSGYLSIVQALISLAVEIDSIGELKADDSLLLLQSRDKWPCTPLFFAALAGQADAICLLLQNEAAIEGAAQIMVSTPLVAAAAGGNSLRYDDEKWKRRHRCLSILLEAGANTNGVDKDGRTTLSWITCPNQIDSLKLLLRHEADPNITDDKGMTPLHYACEFEGSQDIVRTLLAAGADCKVLDKMGRSPLQRAGWSGDCDPTVQLLLEHGALEAGDDAGHQAFQTTLRLGSEHMVNLFIEHGADVNHPGPPHGCPLFAALQKPSHSPRKLPVITLLLKHGADATFVEPETGRCVLHAGMDWSVARTITPTIIHLLVEGGADPNHAMKHRRVLSKGDEIDLTPLGASSYPLLQEEDAMALLLHGADANCVNIEGDPVLLCACSVAIDSQEVALELIKQGADVNKASSGFSLGTYPIHKAAHSGKFAVVDALLDAGALVNERDRAGNTALHKVCSRESRSRDKELREDIRQEFRDNASWWREQQDRGTKRTLEVLLSNSGIDFYTRNNAGETAAHVAAHADNPISMLQLCQAGGYSILCMRDSSGRTPLHVASEHGSVEVTKFILRHSDDVEPHIDVATYLNWPDMQGNTALHQAAMSSHEAVLEILAGHGSIELDAVNARGLTAVQAAVSQGHSWAKIVLLKAEKNRAVIANGRQERSEPD